jgi:hypothetical protein
VIIVAAYLSKKLSGAGIGHFGIHQSGPLVLRFAYIVTSCAKSMFSLKCAATAGRLSVARRREG